MAEEKTIHELPAASSMGDNDLLVMEQSGTAKKMAGSVLGDYVSRYAQGQVAELTQEIDNKIIEVQGAVEEAEGDIARIVQIVDDMMGLGTDTTLSQEGMAADAKAAGDRIAVVEEDLSAVAKEFPTATLTDQSIATFDDGADSMQIKDAVIGIEPVQDLHGYEYPWPAGGSKNLYDINAHNTSNGYVSGRQINADNSATAVSNTEITEYIPVVAGTTYTLSHTTNQYNDNAICFYDVNKDYLEGLDISKPYASSGYTFTAPADAAFCRFSRLGTQMACMLEVGSAATSFVPYANICPIYGYTECDIQVNNTNWLDEDFLFDPNNYIYPASYGYYYTDNKKLRPNTTYTLSAVWNENAIDVSYFNLVVLTGTDVTYDSPRTSVPIVGTGSGNKNPGATFTTGPTGQIFFNIRTNSLENLGGVRAAIDSIQINLGSTVSDYEEYVGRNIPVTFPNSAGTVYGGYITINEDGSAELLVTHRGVRVTLSQVTEDGWATSWNESRIRYTIPDGKIAGPAITKNDPKYICNRFSKDDSGSLYVQFTQNNDGTACFCLFHGVVGITGVTDYTSWNEYLESNETFITYELATPVHYTLDSVQVRTLLGLNNICSNTGNIKSLTYYKDLITDINSKISSTKNSIESMIAGVEETTTVTDNYDAGVLLIAADVLYRLTENVLNGETLEVGVNCEVTTIEDELAALKQGLGNDIEVQTARIDSANAKISNLYNQLPAETLTNQSVASFDDGADNVQINGTVVGIEPVQAGSGDPSPNNVRPISGWTGCNLFKIGTNYLDQSAIEIGSYNSSGAETETGNAKYRRFSVDLPAGTYTFETDLTDCYIIRAIVDNSENIASGKKQSFSFTLAESANVKVTVRNSASTDITDSFRMFVYASGTKQTVTITFSVSAGTVYGGNITINEDGSATLTVDTGYRVFTGEENWTLTDAGSASTGNSGMKSGKKMNGICSIFKTGTESGNIRFGGSANANTSVYILDVANAYGVSTVEDVQLLTTGMEISFPLASPQTYTLDPVTVKTLLGLNNIWADTGNIDLTYRADIGLYIAKKIAEATT